jgi:UDP-glucose 4-epimerase
MNNDDITVIGDGSQTRSFCYIDDNIDTIIKLLDLDVPLINIGSDVEISILDLAKLVKDVLSSKSKIINLPARAEGDMDRRCADNSLMSMVLERELCPLREGVRRTAEFYAK